MTVKVPKVRSKTGEPVPFQSALVPPYVRKTKSLEAAIPWLYLKGISSGEMDAALKVLLGVDAKGLSASTVSRLKQLWAEEYRNWRNGNLWPSLIFRHSIGRASGPAILLNRHSGQSVTAPGAQKGASRVTACCT